MFVCLFVSVQERHKWDIPFPNLGTSAPVDYVFFFVFFFCFLFLFCFVLFCFVCLVVCFFVLFLFLFVSLFFFSKPHWPHSAVLSISKQLPSG